MAEGFTKLFSSITDSTIWSEDNETRIVWITLLAMSDGEGYVAAAIPGIAKRANVSIQAVEVALRKFQQPDPYSRSKEHEGRRVAEVERGWFILNYRRFREIRDNEARKEQNRAAQRKHRASKSKLRQQIESFDMTTKGELAPAEVYEEQDDMAWTREPANG